MYHSTSDSVTIGSSSRSQFNDDCVADGDHKYDAANDRDYDSSPNKRLRSQIMEDISREAPALIPGIAMLAGSDDISLLPAFGSIARPMSIQQQAILSSARLNDKHESLPPKIRRITAAAGTGSLHRSEK
jgi:hypothetical protein